MCTCRGVFVCAVAIFCLCREGFCLCRGAFVCAMTPMGHRKFNKLEHSIGKINHKKKNNFQNRKFIFVKDWQRRNFGITAGVGGGCENVNRVGIHVHAVQYVHAVKHFITSITLSIENEFILID
jgi:hypothetical protein